MLKMEKKSGFFTSPCLEMYRVEALGLSLFNCNFKIFVSM